MAHESFEDEAIAALMNDLFVNIKVDREERPGHRRDLHAARCTILGEQGGWPLTMFLTAGRRALLGRHLFPADAALRPARLSAGAGTRSPQAYRKDEGDNHQERRALRRRARTSSRRRKPGHAICRPTVLDRRRRHGCARRSTTCMAASAGAPKFPQGAGLRAAVARRRARHAAIARRRPAHPDA